VTEEDRGALLSLFDKTDSTKLGQRITPIPICVDPLKTEMLRYPTKGQQIIHLGTMFWPPNIEGVLWFSENVLPLILEEIPDASFIIAGKDPPQSVKDLTSPDTPTFEHVNVTGFIPDPIAVLEGSKVFVVPIRAGGGMRVKILDAWLRGIPVVSTTIGAEGIAVEPGVNILIADSPKEFADAVIKVLMDSELATNLRLNGRSWVEEKYNWHTIYKRVDEIYQRIGRSSTIH
jgi:glycosyltransferase involved in cell wall biosynthesis